MNHFLTQSTASCTSNLRRADNSSCCHKSEAQSHLEQSSASLVLTEILQKTSEKSLMYSSKGVSPKRESRGNLALIVIQPFRNCLSLRIEEIKFGT